MSTNVRREEEEEQHQRKEEEEEQQQHQEIGKKGTRRRRKSSSSRKNFAGDLLLRKQAMIHAPSRYLQPYTHPSHFQLLPAPVSLLNSTAAASDPSKGVMATTGPNVS